MTTLSADDVERMCAGGLAEAREEYGPQWPRDACSDTCSMIIHELSRGPQKRVPVRRWLENGDPKRSLRA